MTFARAVRGTRIFRYAAGVAPVALFWVLSTRVFAQGCAQCLDNTAATPPATRAAYRHAIVLMATTACIIFAAGVALMRRSR